MDTEIQRSESTPPSELPPPVNSGATLLRTEFEAWADSYSGPLPDPETMERYEALTPGAADRMIAMAEESLRHRNEIEKLDLTSLVNMQTSFAAMDAGITRRGQDRAFGATVLLTGLAGWMAYLQQPYLSAFSIASALLYVVYAFLSKNPKAPRLHEPGDKEKDEAS